MELILKDEAKDKNGSVIATFETVLEGDGATPLVMTKGVNPVIKGYLDNGMPIFDDSSDEIVDAAHQEFMAKAIATQKTLTAANGGDPDKVNVIGAENDENKDES